MERYFTAVRFALAPQAPRGQDPTPIENREGSSTRSGVSCRIDRKRMTGQQAGSSSEALRACHHEGYNADVQNPWSELPGQSPYVLQMDGPHVCKYNGLHNSDKRIIVDSLPEPFIGDPQSAKVVLLNLNPGHSEEDAEAHSDASFRGAMIRNLRHELQDYPFYGLNPTFAWTGCGIWWRTHTRRLHEAGLSWQTISNGLFVIEWFPYHSRRSALPIKPVCPSQKYSFQLATELLASKVVVGMRSKKHWLNAVPAVQNVSFLKNPRNPHISPANTGSELFQRIVEALR